MMTRGGEGGKKCPKFDDVICERPLKAIVLVIVRATTRRYCFSTSTTTSTTILFAILFAIRIRNANDIFNS